MQRNKLGVALAVGLGLWFGGSSLAQTPSPSAFTYQGTLQSGGTAVSGTVDLRFRLYNAETGGGQVGTERSVDAVVVTSGLLSTPVDFGPVFAAGTNLWLEVDVASPAGSGTFVTLSPRQRVSPAPRALVADGVPFSGVTSNPWSLPTSGSITTPRALGIGVAVPGYALDVGSRARLRGNGGSESAGVWLSNGTTDQAFVGMLDDIRMGFFGGGTLPGVGWNVVMNTLNGNVGIGTATPGNRLSVSGNADFTGNLGIRTATPIRPLHIVTNEFFPQALIDVPFGGGGTLDASIALRNAGATNYWHLAASVGNFLLATGNTLNNPNFIAISVGPTGLTGIGTGPSGAGFRLELPNVGGPSGQGRANAWVTYSSRDLKRNIATVRDPLTLIEKLRGVTFDWKDPLVDGTHKHDVGFIAEEVAEVLPELVTRTADGKVAGLDYGRVVPVAIEAIKQQQATIRSQQRQIDDLRAQTQRLQAFEAQSAELRTRLERLEKLLATP